VLLKVLKVKLLKEFFKSLIPFLNLDEKFLSMRPCLRTGACTYVQLDLPPLLSEKLKRLQKAEVFVL